MPHVAAAPDAVQLCQSTDWAYASSTVPKLGRPDEDEATGDGEVEATGGAVVADGVVDADGDVDTDGEAEGGGVGATVRAALVVRGTSVAMDGAVLAG